MPDQAMTGGPLLQTGFYGKLPARGDFLSEGVDESVQSAWDAWLQAGMTALKEREGPDWLNVYAIAPVWRFAAPAAAFGADLIGLMLPSQDKVGRCFPFSVLARTPEGMDCRLLALALTSWFNRVEGAVFAALEPGADFAETAARLLKPARLPERLGVQADAGAFTLSAQGFTCPGDVLAASWLSQYRDPSLSLWWRAGDGHHIDNVRFFTGPLGAEDWASLMTASPAPAMQAEGAA